MKKQQTRKQIESNLAKGKENLAKKIAKLEKTEERLVKVLAMLNKKGILTDFDYSSITNENYRDRMVAVYDLFTEMKENGSTKADLNRVYSVTDLMFDMLDIPASIERSEKYVATYEAKLAELGEPTEEEVAKAAAKKAEKTLREYLKTEAANLNVESLNEWLAGYRSDFLEWLEVSKTLKAWEKAELRGRIDEIVAEQKFEIIYKTYNKIGRITDISFGRLGDNGKFNGYVTGEKGKCKIETILAGGYNIQRLHYRVLVK